MADNHDWIAQAITERYEPQKKRQTLLARVRDATIRRAAWAGEALMDFVPGFDSSPKRHVSFTGSIPNDRYIGYQPAGYRALRTIRKRLDLTPDDVIYEVGCGKGRSVCYFALQNIKRVVGVELMPELANAARRNAVRLIGRKAEIEIRTEDAVATDFSDATMVLMYHPFGPEVMRPVAEHLDVLPQKVRIVYVNPIYAGVITRFTNFIVTDEFDVPFESASWRTLVLERTN